jgi:hypothetical protein
MHHSRSHILRFLLLSLLLTVTLSCEKEIDIDYRTVSPLYVAEVELTPGLAKARITTTRAIENNQVTGTYVDNATVTMSMTNGGWTFPLEYKGKGIYETSYPTMEGSEYLVDIEIDGDHYTSTSTMLSEPVINSFDFVWMDVMGERILFADLRLMDIPDEHNYYFMHIYRNSVGYRWAVMRDTANPGDELQQLFSCSTERDMEKGDKDALKDGDRIKLEVRSIDKLAYDYLYSLQMMDNTGSNPIQNFSGGLLGYFSAYQSKTLERIFHEYDIQ